MAIWVRGYRTGTWANVLEGINPLLTIRAADQGVSLTEASGSQGSSVLLTAGVTVGGLAPRCRRPWLATPSGCARGKRLGSDVGLAQRSGMSPEP